MLRSFTLLLIPVLMLTLRPATADAQWPPTRGQFLDPLSGSYVNAANGGSCSVQPWGSGYLFINEHGSQAHFEFLYRNRLYAVGGDWNFNGVATVVRGPHGRTGIRFDAPNTASGYWERVH